MGRAARTTEEHEFAIAMGQRIRDLRIRAGYTQTRLVRELPDTVDGSMLSKWEHGHTTPGGYTLVMLASALGTTTDYLLKG